MDDPFPAYFSAGNMPPKLNSKTGEMEPQYAITVENDPYEPTIPATRGLLTMNPVNKNTKHSMLFSKWEAIGAPEWFYNAVDVSKHIGMDADWAQVESDLGPGKNRRAGARLQGAQEEKRTFMTLLPVAINALPPEQSAGTAAVTTPPPAAKRSAKAKAEAAPAAAPAPAVAPAAASSAAGSAPDPELSSAVENAVLEALVAAEKPMSLRELGPVVMASQDSPAGKANAFRLLMSAPWNASADRPWKVDNGVVSVE
jgi:hypothetical protein